MMEAAGRLLFIEDHASRDDVFWSEASLEIKRLYFEKARFIIEAALRAKASSNE